MLSFFAHESHFVVPKYKFCPSMNARLFSVEVPMCFSITGNEQFRNLCRKSRFRCRNFLDHFSLIIAVRTAANPEVDDRIYVLLTTHLKYAILKLRFPSCLKGVVHFKLAEGHIMKTCQSCLLGTVESARFCPACGERFPAETLLPYIGVASECGIYRVTFPPQEREFQHEDAARDAARHASWNNDGEFEGRFTVEFVRSTATPKTHPYECSNCKPPNMMVSQSNEGRCALCGGAEWIRRVT